MDGIAIWIEFSHSHPPTLFYLYGCLTLISLFLQITYIDAFHLPGGNVEMERDRVQAAVNTIRSRYGEIPIVFLPEGAPGISLFLLASFPPTALIFSLSR